MYGGRVAGRLFRSFTRRVRFPGWAFCTVKYKKKIREHLSCEKKFLLNCQVPSSITTPSEEVHFSAASLDSPRPESLVQIPLFSFPSESSVSVDPRPALQFQRSDFFPSWLPEGHIHRHATTFSFEPRPIANPPYACGVLGAHE